MVTRTTIWEEIHPGPIPMWDFIIVYHIQHSIQVISPSSLVTWNCTVRIYWMPPTCPNSILTLFNALTLSTWLFKWLDLCLWPSLLPKEEIKKENLNNKVIFLEFQLKEVRKKRGRVFKFSIFVSVDSQKYRRRIKDLPFISVLHSGLPNYSWGWSPLFLYLPMDDHQTRLHKKFPRKNTLMTI